MKWEYPFILASAFSILTFDGNLYRQATDVGIGLQREGTWIECAKEGNPDAVHKDINFSLGYVAGSTNSTLTCIVLQPAQVV